MISGNRRWFAKPWFGSCLCVILLCLTAIFHISCNPCAEENQEKCDTSCERQANCVITYSYNEAGSRIKLNRVCRWLSSEGSSDCAKCTDEKKDEKGRVISHNCVVCNVCNAEFECLEDGECKAKDSARPYCRRGVCSSCQSDGDCKDPRKPTCTDQGCACTEKSCGCSNDADCKDANKPQCDEGTCVVCQCPNTQPKRPFCLKKSDGAVECVACIEDSDCGGSTPRCDSQSRTCVSCKQDTDCKDSTKPQCHSGACVACRCPQTNPDKPACIKNADDTVTCVACLKDADCQAPNPKCNTKTNACEAACTQDEDCPSSQLCDQGQCVDCKSRDDCKDPQAPRCVSGTCRCVNDKDCPTSLPICSQSTGRCVECTRNGDCPATFPVCSSAGVCELLSCLPENGGKECAAIPSHSLCRRVGRSYRCVGCAGDSECKSDEVCDLSRFVCARKN